MAAHRYWRALSLEAYGFSGLELSEFQLMAGATRVDAGATLTANVAPVSGSLANLKDDSVSTSASWNAADVRTLVLVWDFGAGGDQDVSDIRLGSVADPAKFLLVARLQYSDDGRTWADAFTYAGMLWPGVRTKTASVVDTTGPNTVSLLHFNGANGSTAIADVMGKTWTAQGNAQISTASPIFVGQSLLLDGTGDWVQTTSGLSDFALGAGDFLVEVRFRITSKTAAQCLLDFYTNTGSGNNWQLWLNASRTPEWYRGGAVGTGAVLTSNAGAATLNDVHHLVVFRRSGVLFMFYDGVPAGSVADATDYSSVIAGSFSIGAQVGLRNAAYDFQGNIDEVRVVKGAGGVLRFPFVPALMGEYDTAPKYAIARSVFTRPVLSTPSPTGAGNIPAYGVHRAIPSRFRGRSDYLTGVLGQGIGRVRGFTLDYVNPLNKPYPCRVVLVREVGNLAVREQWSKADGSYDFQFVDELQSYTVIAYYEAHAKRAVVTDGLTRANGKVELMA
jgi:hypothetical protein